MRKVASAQIAQRFQLNTVFWAFHTTDRVKWRHISIIAIRSPFCRSRPSYCA